MVAPIPLCVRELDIYESSQKGNGNSCSRQRGRKTEYSETMGNFYVIWKCPETHPDVVRDDNIAIYFMHIF